MSYDRLSSGPRDLVGHRCNGCVKFELNDGSSYTENHFTLNTFPYYYSLEYVIF